MVVSHLDHVVFYGMVEVWLPVVGFEGLYDVSDCGNIRRIAGGRGAKIGRILRSNVERDGYLAVDLRVEKRRVRKKIHHVVLEAFTGQRPFGMEANHINGDKTDNNIVNLQWVTHRDNIKHAVDSGLMPDNYRNFALGRKCSVPE